MDIKNKISWRTIIILISLIVVLVSARVLWIKQFTVNQTQKIINGQLDLRDWDFEKYSTVILDGEWEFYPYEWYMDTNGQNKELIHVPGDWSSVLNPKTESPYGYGSYRLKILVDPSVEKPFSMRIASVRSASEMYVNGRYMGGLGTVGESEETFNAKNVPYSSHSIYTDETGEIEVVLHVANFTDPRSSGIIRTVKFGYEENIMAETNLSTLLQVLSSTILFIFSIFSIILYVIGIKDGRLIYFAFVIGVGGLLNLTGGDEKVLFKYVPFSYEATFKLIAISIYILGWAIIHLVKRQIEVFSKRILKVYTAIVIILCLFNLFIPLEYLKISTTLSLLNVLIPILITASISLLSNRTIKGGIWLAASIISFGSYFAWWFYLLAAGIKVIYYPFEIILASILFGGRWFRHYYELYQEIEEQKGELQQIDKAKNEFLANTSHELRNPLHSILNISKVVLEKEYDKLNQESVKNLQTILAVSRQMSFTVNSLFELTNLQEGKPKLHLKSISLQGVVEGVIDMLSFKVDGKNLRVVNEVPYNFPPVLADENRLIQIIFNLLHNAMKYTHEGEIKIQAEQKGKQAKISVIDTGIGIEKGLLDSIFDPYKQAHEGSIMSDGGIGLGLNICKELVHLHGGFITVESTIGVGSTFSFTLKILDLLPEQVLVDKKTVFKNDIEDVQVNQLAAEKLVSVEGERKKQRILIVDDDPINLHVVEAILSSDAYEVTSVLSAKTALERISEEEWDLIISDVMMPHMSGYSLTEKIRGRFSMNELPILLLTARNAQGDLEYGFSIGANDYVTKPVEAGELRSRVAALTNMKRMMEERIDMEVAWLQAQIKPHFVFNALNTIIALSEIDLVRMRKVVNAFSFLLRKKFQFNQLNQFSSIQDEIELIKEYLIIEKERFQERLLVKWIIDEGICARIPSLIIQPLVENAIHHGIMRKEEGGTLTIQIIDQMNHIEISVIDTGVGMSEEKIGFLLNEQAGEKNGVGIKNTNLRLIRHYGVRLQIVSVLGQGTTVSFRIPKNN